MNLFTSSMYNFAILCPYKITYLLHSIFILPSKYILRWKYILRNKNQLNLIIKQCTLLRKTHLLRRSTGAQINQPGRSVVSGVGLLSEGYTAIPTSVHVMMNPSR